MGDQNYDLPSNVDLGRSIAPSRFGAAVSASTSQLRRSVQPKVDNYQKDFSLHSRNDNCLVFLPMFCLVTCRDPEHRFWFTVALTYFQSH